MQMHPDGTFLRSQRDPIDTPAEVSFAQANQSEDLRGEMAISQIASVPYQLPAAWQSCSRCRATDMLCAKATRSVGRDYVRSGTFEFLTVTTS